MTTEHDTITAPVSSTIPHAEEPAIQEDSLDFMLRGEPAQVPLTGVRVLEVGQVWGQTVLDVQHFAAGSAPITLSAAATPHAGKRATGSFYMPPDSLPSDGWPLLRWEGELLIVRVCRDWRGFIELGGTRRSLESLIRDGGATPAGHEVFELPLKLHECLTLEIGAFIFVARQVAAHRRVTTAVRDRMDYPMLSALAFVGFMAVMMFLVLLTTPLPAEASTRELDNHIVELLLEKPVEPPPVVADKKLPPKEEEGKRAKKEEGKAGEKDAKMKIAKGDKVKLNKRRLDQEVATSSGVLAAMRDGAASDVFASSALSSSLTSGVGGLIGAKGTQMGAGGLGGRGSGLGGGGEAEGIGGLGTNGRGGGSRNYGANSGEFGGKRVGDPIALNKEALYVGSLDKSLIDAVIKRNMGQIRNCYQRGLTRDPSLAGKITVKFVISKDGTVSKSEVKTSSMGNAEVEGCIADRIMHFQFPEPKGGGIVLVSYPFMFSQG